MSSMTSRISFKSRLMPSILLVLGAVLLVGTWVALSWGEALFTESHLVGYYCCVTGQELPAPGTLERTLSDFFRTFPGMHLPSLVFVGGNIYLFARSMRRGGREYWWTPFLFAALNVLYLMVNFELVVASWAISDRLVGPQTAAYKGYHHTWYGIILHLMLWGAYFVALSKVVGKLVSRHRSF